MLGRRRMKVSGSEKTSGSRLAAQLWEGVGEVFPADGEREGDELGHCDRLAGADGAAVKGDGHGDGAGEASEGGRVSGLLIGVE
jgi:hypothetical protein